MKPLEPTPTLLSKLGSIVVHIEEHISTDSHPFDLYAAKLLLIDPEVVEWLRAMDDLAMIPKKRQA